MSTIAALSSDLSSLISESRRRNNEIKHATEYSLNILKKYDTSQLSEADFIRQLTQEPNFITPFILSCQSRNAKFSSIAIHCLHRLIAAHGLPLGSLENILDSLIEASHLPLEIQLKVLQLLPTIYQAFGKDMNDNLISKLLLICAVLQGPNKPAVVVNTAAATLQQLIIFIFDKVNDEDQLNDEEVVKSYAVKIDNNKQVQVSDNVYDCYRIFDDLCSLIERHRPSFLQFNYLTETFLLELIESILTNFTQVFIKHTELGYLLRFRVTPILLRSLSLPTKEFSVVVRIARIIDLLVRKDLQILRIECEIVISLLNHMILSDMDSPTWKKIIVLEIFSSIFKDFNLIIEIFKEYDYNNDRKHVINDFLVNCFCLVDSASSKNLIKFRSVLHAPIPTKVSKSGNENDGNSTGAAKSSSASSGSSSASNSLIAFVSQPQEFIIDSSSEKIPYIEMLDKTEPPAVPDNYIYYLILSCYNNFVDGMGKYVMELSLSSESNFQAEIPSSGVSSKQFKFLDKMDNIKSPKLKKEVLLLQSVILKNYKVLLSTFEVFLYSKLSNECFHNLIRSLQKLCYSSGILGLSQPRDDIIMVFAISTVNNSDESYNNPKTNSKSERSSIDSRTARESFNRDNTKARNEKPKPVIKENKSLSESLFGSLSSKFSSHANNINQNLSSLATSITNATSPTSPLQHGGIITSTTANGQLVLHSRYINSRHLITLRALINLAISLGPSLGFNWKNIFITLQWVEFYLHGPPENFDKKYVYNMTKYGNMPIVKQNEIAVIQNSVKKLYDSFKDYLLPSFLVVLRNLIELSDSTIFAERDRKEEKYYYDATVVSVFDSFHKPQVGGSSEQQTKRNEFTPIKDVKLSACYYNKEYFLDLLGTISRTNSPRFLIECAEDDDPDLLLHEDHNTDKITSLKVVFNYLIELSTNRSLTNHLRMKSGTIFNTLIKTIFQEGFTNANLVENLAKRNKQNVLENSVDYKLLGSLFDILDAINQLQQEDKKQTSSNDDNEDQKSLKIVPVSALVLNLEFEFIYKSLENLKDLLDMFGVYFNKVSWELIFKIIDLAFEFFNYSEIQNDAAASSYGSLEKKSVLIKIDFEILQLILSDFLTVLPLNIIKKLINSIYKFSEQDYDINISFSAISYFWQISDYIRDLLNNNVAKENYESGNNLLVSKIKTQADLMKYVDTIEAKENDTDEEKFTTYSCLWIYLLNVLINICDNPKDQVRNGSVQTFFRILDSHGKHLSSWDLCYNIVISSLFEIRPKIQRDSSWEDLAKIREQWSETLVLIVNGTVKFYNNYFSTFDALEPQLAFKYWSGLMSYFEDILKLGWNNCDLKLYEAFNDLLKQNETNKKIFPEIIELLFKFWVGRNVSYNVTLNKHYQDSLTSLMKAFIPLSQIIGINMDHEKIRKSLDLFNSVVKYPILPTYFNDNVYPTDLQKSVLDNLKLIVNNKDPEIQSDVILHLVSNVVLPFSTRVKIKEQLSKSKLPNDAKISTFVSLSYYSTKILQEQIKKVESFKPLIKNGCITKTMAFLLEPIKQNAKGIHKRKESNKDGEPPKELWMECITIILFILEKIITIIAKDNDRNEVENTEKENLWYLIVEIYKTSLNVNSTNYEHEEFNVKTLNQLRSIIIPYISLQSFPETLLDNFTSYILESSYVYEKDEIELSLLEENKDIEQSKGKKNGSPVIKGNIDIIAQKFSNFNFNDHIPLVKPLKFAPSYKINLICLNDLIELSKIPNAKQFKKLEQEEYRSANNLEIISIQSQQILSSKVFSCLIIRTLYILRKFISGGTLANQAPLSKIQRLEMIIILKGLNDLLDNFNQSTKVEQLAKLKQLSVILPLIIKTIPIASRVRGVSGLIESFFYEYNENLKLLS